MALIPLAPISLHGAFFGIFSMTESIGQAIGPLIIGALGDATGSLRSGFAYMLGEAVVCIALLLLLKPEAGACAAARYDAVRLQCAGSSVSAAASHTARTVTTSGARASEISCASHASSLPELTLPSSSSV